MMTLRQQNQFNAMRAALLKIARGYQSPRALRKAAKASYGLPYEEVLEMAYENMQSEATLALKGVKPL